MWSSGTNETADVIELLTIQFAVDPNLARAIMIEVVEIYEFTSDGDLTVPEYTVD